jgi:hypothetical protein
VANLELVLTGREADSECAAVREPSYDARANARGVNEVALGRESDHGSTVDDRERITCRD